MWRTDISTPVGGLGQVEQGPHPPAHDAPLYQTAVIIPFVWKPFPSLSHLTFKVQLDPARSGMVPGCPASRRDGVWSPARTPTLLLTSCAALGYLTMQSLDPFLYKTGVMEGGDKLGVWG